MFRQVRLAALLILRPSRFFHKSSSMGLFNFCWFQELETRAVELEDGHDGFAVEDTLLNVAILLSVEILVALGIEVVEHVLREVRQVGLKVTRARSDDVLDEESDECFFARGYCCCRFYH